MKLAIMQPYIFPFIGYFQLINVVDKFVYYDDVNFIKRGWVNRNKVLVNNNSFLFSIPVSSSSQNKKINEIEISIFEYKKWMSKFLKTIKNSYNKAPFFKKTFEILEITFTSDVYYMSELAMLSIKNVCNYLNMEKKFEMSSALHHDSVKDDKADRLINICKKSGARHYINPIGGMELYSKEYFHNKGIILSFLKSKEIIYKQFDDQFIPSLSIIDILMFNSCEDIVRFLPNYELI